MNNFKTTKKQVNIDHIVPNPWNPNVQNEAMFQKEINSIKELGMLGSILVRDFAGMYQILDGEHRWKAAKELGYTEMVVETMGEIEDNQAKLLTILLNNLRGKDDIEKRAKIYQELEQGQLQLLPFSEQEIENEKKLIEFDFSQYDKEKSDRSDAKKDRQLYIMIPVAQDEYDLYKNTIVVAKEKGMTEQEFLFKQIEDFLFFHGFQKELITNQEDGTSIKKFIFN